MPKLLFALAAVMAAILAITLGLALAHLFGGLLDLPRWAGMAALTAVFAAAGLMRWRHRGRA